MKRVCCYNCIMKTRIKCEQHCDDGSYCQGDNHYLDNFIQNNIGSDSQDKGYDNNDDACNPYIIERNPENAGYNAGDNHGNRSLDNKYGCSRNEKKQAHHPFFDFPVTFDK